MADGCFSCQIGLAMKTPSPFERELGKAIRSRFGAETKVVRFGDDDGRHDVFIVSGADCPVSGVTSYGTVGLSQKIQPVGPSGAKVELVAACAAQTPHIDNLLASCVFDSVKNGSAIVYASCIADILVQYGVSSTLKHVTFVAPFLWNGLNRLSVDGEEVLFLMMLPISDAERTYLTKHGIDALEALFSKKQIDIYDINRPSAVS